MRVKKQYLNEKCLGKYGFEKEILYGDPRFVEYMKENDELGATILVQRCSGEICIVMHEDTLYHTDTVSIDNTIYYLILDGLVEI